jgi:TM2 domain-containing membrane protein YozV
VVPKSQAGAIFLSFLIPGAGSMYAGSAGMGAVILGTWIVGALLTIALIGWPILIGAWIWGMVHAHGAARKWNADHGIIS